MEMKRKILVADDEAHITHVVSLKFRKAGFEVVTAQDGEEAYELAVQERPDLVITDLQMPFMSGVELSAKLRDTPATSEIPVIMLTARGLALSHDDLARTNIKSVMSKPFSPKQVLERALSLLGMDRAGDEEAEAA
jgi:DNA-binding response OmpR family regulator